MKRILYILLCIPFIALTQTQVGQTLHGESIISGFNVLPNEMGNAISFNEDGSRMIVGSRGYLNGKGEVEVFELQNNTWIRIGQPIIGIGSANNGVTFGQAVAISADGNTIAASASGPNAEGGGYVKVYKFQSGGWVQTGSFTDGVFTFFGVSIKLSSDGNRLAIGASRKWSTGMNSGQVRVYENQSGTWVQIGQDLNGQINNHFGTTLDMSSDGSILAVGGPKDDGNIDYGRIKMYSYQSGSWVEIHEFLPDQDEYGVGIHVDLTPNGNTIAFVSQYLVNGVDFKTQVRIFKNIAGTWTQIGNTIQEQNITGFADKIRISEDENIILVGSSISDINGFTSGEVHIYQNQLGVWNTILDSYAGMSGDYLGRAIALTNDGNTFAIGANFADFNDISDAGTVQVYDMESDLALLEVVDDIQGNLNGINVTAEQLNAIDGVSGAIDGVDYTTALNAGTFADENNPTAAEIQFIIDQINDALSVNEYVISDFKLYPNPAKTQFTVELKGNHILQTLQVYNTLGQLILSSKGLVVDTSKLSSGSYLVEVTTNKGTSVKQLIIE